MRAAARPWSNPPRRRPCPSPPPAFPVPAASPLARAAHAAGLTSICFDSLPWAAFSALPSLLSASSGPTRPPDVGDDPGAEEARKSSSAALRRFSLATSFLCVSLTHILSSIFLPQPFPQWPWPLRLHQTAQVGSGLPQSLQRLTCSRLCCINFFFQTSFQTPRSTRAGRDFIYNNKPVNHYTESPVA